MKRRAGPEVAGSRFQEVKGRGQECQIPQTGRAWRRRAELPGREWSCWAGTTDTQRKEREREGGRKVTDMIQENVSVSSQHLSEDSWTARPAEGVWCNILQQKAELCFVLSAEAVEQVLGQEDRIISNQPELVILVGWT